MEGTMAGMLRTMKLLTMAVVLAAGGLAFWRWREKATQTWISIGSLDGIIESAGYLVENARPVNRPVTPMPHPR
jgi:hypothetical protein